MALFRRLWSHRLGGEKMKIFKGNYGYSFLAKGKEDEKGTFVSVQFPKEENILSEEIDGKLYFEHDGIKRDCFVTTYPKKDGTFGIKIVMSADGGFKRRTTFEQTTLRGDGRDLTGHFDDNKVVIETDDLPFL